MRILLFIFPILLWASPEKRLSQGIQFQTISFLKEKALKDFKDYQSFLKKTYPLTFKNLKLKMFNESLLLTWEGRDLKKPHTLFNSHYDVVPVEEKDLTSWQHPPFSGKINEGYIWGRGSLDDKVGLQATLEAIEKLLRDEFEPETTLHFALTHDEEMGGWQGANQITQYFIDNNIKIESVYDEGLVIINDVLPDFPKPVALIGVGEKGYLSIKLSTFKEGGHSAMPDDVTAYTILNKALQKLSGPIFKRKITSTMTRFLENLGQHKDGLSGFVLRNPSFFASFLISELQKSPASDALLRTTRAITVVKAGIKDNKVPNSAEAIINFRLLQGDTTERILKVVKNKIKDKRVQIEVINLKDAVNPSPIASLKTDGYKKLKQSINNTFPEAVVAPNIMVARTDSFHYQKLTPNIYRFLPLRISKSELSRIHGLNERISVDNYRKAILFYENLIKNY